MSGLWPTLILTFFLGLTSGRSEEFRRTPNDPNSVVLEIIKTMPKGGGYSVTGSATRNLQSAAQVRGGKLTVEPMIAHETYCSGATYLVFLRFLEKYSPGSTITGPLAEALSIRGQPDGVGVWGRWNANGPGTACLVHELNAGTNFTSFEEARPGDFMKIFWSQPVGRREHGHSVVYLGRDFTNGVETVRFWSSNQPNGYGEKSVPRSRIVNALFSRIDHPGNIQHALSLPSKNTYLAGLLAKDSSIDEAVAQSGAR